ncbi:MAG: DUF4170 domain-containing protein [Stellaceae bacterium]
MSNYWVVGAEYTDTSFEKLAPGAREERLGPFASYRAAYQAWQARASATIDDPTVRYRIVDALGKDARAKKRAA